MTIRTPASRRAFLSIAGASALALTALAGCGFKLRQAPVFAFSTIAVPGRSVYLSQLRRALETTGTLTLVPETAPDTAQVIFEVLAERRDRVVLSTTPPARCARCNCC